MRKKIVLLLSILMLFSMGIGFANERAEELNTLKILKGYDGNFQLDEKLTRAEGLTFVIRLLGEEEFLMEKKQFFLKTKFEDVDEEAWYAPYVGYGRAFSMIQGYEDGTFRPNANLSEREFYTMVLNALEIENNWESVEETAKAEGLIESADGMNDSDYLRENVVDVLYRTLDSRKELISNLINESIITEEEANSLKVYKTDEVKTSIERTRIKDKNTLVITLNESIESAEVSLSDNIEISSKEIDGDQINLVIDDTTDKEYELVLTNIVDMHGFEVERLEGTFDGYKPKEISSNRFLISKIEPQSKNLIYVYFTHPLTSNAEVEFNYDIYTDGELFVEGEFSTMEASLIGADNHVVGLWLKTERFINEKEYTLKINGNLTSGYNAELDSGNGDEMDFYASGAENADLAIDKFLPYENDIIRIKFTKDVDESSATDTSNYTLENTKYGDLTPSSASLTGLSDEKYRQVDLEFLPSGALNDDRNKILVMEDIKDVFKAAEISKEEVDFTSPIPVADDEIKITSVNALNKSLIYVYFDRAITNIDNTKLNNVVISNATYDDNTYIFDNNKPYMIKMFIDSGNYLNSGDQTIDFQSDTFTNGVGIGNSSDSITFKGSEDDIPKIVIREAFFIEDDKILVKYNYPVDSTSGSIAGNYRLNYKDDDGDDQYINASNVGQIDDMTFSISFNDLDSEDYKIEADNIKDYSKAKTTSDITKSVER